MHAPCNMRSLSAFLLLGIISCFPSVCCAQIFDLGEINSARCKSYVPADWDGGLLMYAHGPVLALHTLYDELLPVSHYQYYEELTEINGTGDYNVHQYVVSDGHYEFTTPDVADAFDLLLSWIREGQRPEPIYR